MNISLPDQMKAFAEAQAREGRFSNVSDYMRELIRRDQDRQGAVSELQGLIDEGIASGPAQPFDMDDFITRAKARPTR